jgi:hypothetical protein
VAKGFFVLNLISWPKKIIVAKESWNNYVAKKDRLYMYTTMCVNVYVYIYTRMYVHILCIYVSHFKYVYMIYVPHFNNGADMSVPFRCRE